MTQLLDRAGLPEATAFIRRKLTAFDLSKLDKLTLTAGLRANPLSWRVKKPVRAAKGSRQFKSQFEVTSSVIGDKYHSDDCGDPVAVPVIGAKELGAPPELSIAFHTRAEMLVYATAAGCYHYLRRTRQVPGVAANWMARRYACGWAAEFSTGVYARPNTVADLQSYVNCFGMHVPAALVKTKDQGAYFFDDPVTLIESAEGRWPLLPALSEAQQAAVARSIDRTFRDCDPGLLAAIKSTADATMPWLILADWLEERGDRRAGWIRAHRLDLAAAHRQKIDRQIAQTQPS